MIEEILADWASQRSKITELNEAELNALIALELDGQARKTILVRAQQRLSKLKALRERELLDARIGDKNA